MLSLFTMSYNNQRPKYHQNYHNNNNPNNQNRPRNNFNRSQSTVVRPQQPQTPVQDIQDCKDEIPSFHADDYAGFKDVLLSASLPGTYQPNPDNNYQKMIEQSLKYNEKVLESLLNAARALSDVNESIAQPPSLSSNYLDIERATADFDVAANAVQMLSNPIHQIVNTDV